MRILICATLLCAAASLLTACAGGERAAVGSNGNAAQSNAKSSIAHAPSGAKPADATNAAAPGVASSHGSAPATPGGPSREKSPVDTSAFDAKIKKAVERVKAGDASAADKKAAADAYLERAESYWSAGDPSLYKYALADYRSVVHYQPDNRQAKERIDYLISIYKSMKRPVPELSNEQ